MNVILEKYQEIYYQTTSTHLWAQFCDWFRQTEWVGEPYLLSMPACPIRCGGVVVLIINTWHKVRSDINTILRTKRSLLFNTTNPSE